MKTSTKILIDNGHGRETPGKCSPDGHFKEYQYTREIAAAVVAHLQYRDIDAQLLVPELEDISLEERVHRVNKFACRVGLPITDTFVVSIHVNAAGNGKRWMNATGWCAYTYYGHSESDKLADCIYRAAEKHLKGHYIRKDFTDGDPDIEAPFYILKYTYCAAVLTENGFMDNELSLKFLESEEGKKAIVALHVEGIIDYVEEYEKRRGK